MSTRQETPALSYSQIELQSYLPSGWNLQAAEGEYLPLARRWQIEVEDVGELVSTLAVDEAEAERLGRIPALRAAIDRLYRSC